MPAFVVSVDEGWVSVDPRMVSSQCQCPTPDPRVQRISAKSDRGGPALLQCSLGEISKMRVTRRRHVYLTREPSGVLTIRCARHG